MKIQLLGSKQACHNKDLEDYKSIDRLIKNGNIREAASLLEAIPLGRASRAEALELARLFRRVGLAEKALSLLAPFVRPRKVLTQPATAAEKAEYVISLQRLGSIMEASKLSREIDETLAPEILLYRAILEFSQWNYGAGLPDLTKLVDQFKSADPYLLQTARVNIAAALVHTGRMPDALNLLDSLKISTHENEQWLLHCNTLQLLAHVHVLSGSFDKAKEALNQAETFLSGIKTLDRLFLIKWRALLEGFKAGQVEALQPARAEALRKNHWETLRDLDFYSLKIRFDESVFLKLHFGTLAPHFRRRLSAHFPQATVPAEIALGPEWRYASPPAADALDPLADLTGDLGAGTVTHAAFMLLLSDSYKSFRSGEVHSTLFPADFFNPDTSLNRVHQAMHRTRQALETQLPGVEIIAKASTYRLRIPPGGPALKWSVGLKDFSPDQIRLEILKRTLTTQATFTSGDTQKVFGISRSAANRLLQQWRESGLLTASEKGRRVGYKIKT